MDGQKLLQSLELKTVNPQSKETAKCTGPRVYQGRRDPKEEIPKGFAGILIIRPANFKAVVRTYTVG